MAPASSLLPQSEQKRGLAWAGVAGLPQSPQKRAVGFRLAPQLPYLWSGAACLSKLRSAV